jgi:CBS domain-containing protein
MKTVTLQLPQFAFIVGTRAALGTGIGLLMAGLLPTARRKRLGTTLVAAGAATTVPAALLLARRIDSSDDAHSNRFSQKGGRVKARDFMTTEPQFVTPDMPISKAAQIMRQHDIGLVPVVDRADSRRLIGVITDRDIAVRHVAEGHTQECTVRSHMTQEAIETVSEHDDSAAVFDAMKRREVRRIPVTSADGRLIGVIAQADIATTESIAPKSVADVVRAVSEPAHH